MLLLLLLYSSSLLSTHTHIQPLISHFSASGDRRDAHFHIPASSLQKLLFSASMTHSPEHLSQLQLHTPHLFTTHTPMQRGKKGGGGESSDITFTLPTQLMEKLVRCDIQHKPLALLHLLTCDKGCGEMARVLCFTNSRDSTHRQAHTHTNTVKCIHTYIHMNLIHMVLY